jgi:hypothetical protein
MKRQKTESVVHIVKVTVQITPEHRDWLKGFCKESISTALRTLLDHHIATSRCRLELAPQKLIREMFSRMVQHHEGDPCVLQEAGELIETLRKLLEIAEAEAHVKQLRDELPED